ncbi:MAG: NUDIX domain-containing protein [Candidatus Thorarchaeota archaeon]
MKKIQGEGNNYIDKTIFSGLKLGMNSAKVFWEQKITLSDVSWEHDPQYRFNFSSKVLRLSKLHWKELSRQYSALYDGRILVLQNISESSGVLTLTTSWIEFSLLAYHNRNELSIPGTHGVLGCKVLITNPKETHFLAGVRSQKSEHKPGFLMLPGGLFEISDINGTLQEACLRELREELEIQVQEDLMDLIAIIRGEKGNAAILMIHTKCGILGDGEAPDVSIPVAGNEEWQDNILRWIPLEQIPYLDSTNLMEGLKYLKSRNS